MRESSAIPTPYPPGRNRARPTTLDALALGLAPLKNLTTLRLSQTSVTGTGLKELAALKNLTTLSLSGTAVTDAGLKELAALKNLTTLHLDFTQVTEEGAKAFQAALPKCMIDK